MPTQETMPRPLGLTPAAGVSVSSLSFSTACRQTSLHGSAHADKQEVLCLGRKGLPKVQHDREPIGHGNCPEEVWRTWKHLFMCCMTLMGLLPLDRMSSKSAEDTK